MSLSTGQRILRERLSLGLSQQQLAEAIDASITSINRWEHDKTLPRPYHRRQLCSVFEKQIEELFGTLDEEDQAEQEQHLIWNVPYHRNLYFTGREDILRSLQETFQINNSTDRTRICALNGLGGMGKTQIAIEYAYRSSENYSAVLWASAGTRQKLVSSFCDSAQLLPGLRSQRATPQDYVNEVLHWLGKNQRWLCIFDGADDLEMVREFLPKRGNGHVLLTTRSQILGPYMKGLLVPPLGQSESLSLLLRRARLIADTTEITDIPADMRRDGEVICELLGGLPLALDQAASYIEESQCELRNYSTRYRQSSKELLQRRGGVGEEEENKPVATTWTASFQQVERNNRLAADLLRLMTFLHPGAIPQEMLLAGIAGLDDVLQPIVHNPLLLDDTITELRRHSLVRRWPETKMITIHRVVRVVLKDTLNEVLQRQWAMRVVKFVNQLLLCEEMTQRFCQFLLPHLQTCYALIQQWDLQSPEVTQLLTRAKLHSHEDGAFSEAADRGVATPGRSSEASGESDDQIQRE